MNLLDICSDQLFKWSDHRGRRYGYKEEINPISAKAPSGSVTQTSSSRRHSSRLPHRTLQALWQAWLQVRQRPRPWPQILSVGEFPEFAAASGLCPTGASRQDHAISRQLSACSRSVRRNLRDQSRIAASEGGALRTHDEHRLFFAYRTNRSSIGKHYRRQHARELAGFLNQCLDYCGGAR